MIDPLPIAVRHEDRGRRVDDDVVLYDRVSGTPLPGSAVLAKLDAARTRG